MCLSAHPKVDPVTRRALHLLLSGEGRCHPCDIVFYRFGADRKLLNEIWFEMPNAACAQISPSRMSGIVFPFFPLITDLEVTWRRRPLFPVESR